MKNVSKIKNKIKNMKYIKIFENFNDDESFSYNYMKKCLSNITNKTFNLSSEDEYNEIEKDLIKQGFVILSYIKPLNHNGEFKIRYCKFNDDGEKWDYEIKKMIARIFYKFVYDYGKTNIKLELVNAPTLKIGYIHYTLIDKNSDRHNPFYFSINIPQKYYQKFEEYIKNKLGAEINFK